MMFSWIAKRSRGIVVDRADALRYRRNITCNKRDRSASCEPKGDATSWGQHY